MPNELLQSLMTDSSTDRRDQFLWWLSDSAAMSPRAGDAIS